MTGPVVALCGGVGGAKLAHGLARTLPRGALTVIVNTGDDFDHLGLRICPDLDAVVYALSGLDDPARGWGRRNETWSFMNALTGLGGQDWFQLGDADLAMHVMRTHALSKGATLAEFTRAIVDRLELGASILPMSDARVHTELLTDEGWLEFQEYFVHRGCRPRLRELRFAGATSAPAQPQALAALARSDLEAVVICPSNPFVSIAPILSLPELRSSLATVSAPVIAVTPIVGGKAIKGPAGKMLAELGLPVTPESVARQYEGLIDGFVSDSSDSQAPEVPDVRNFRFQTLMHGVSDRELLARGVLSAARELRNAVRR